MSKEEKLEQTNTFSTAATSSSTAAEKSADDDSNLDHNLPWTLKPEQAVNALNSHSERGLSYNECEKKKTEFGSNALEDSEGVSIIRIIAGQILNSMVIVLIVCMAISFGIQDWIAGGVIAGVVGINVVVGSYQEYKAAATLASLKSLSSPTARVIRNGNDETVASIEVVPGDLIMINVGDTVPADCRLLECTNFETDEALLTGESLPISKEPLDVFEKNCPVGDRINMAYSSSTVTKGRAKGLVTTTGMNTEIGKIAQSLKGNNSNFRSVQRDDEGNARKRDYMSAFIGSVKDVIGQFLGTTGGTPLHRALSKLALWLFGVAVILAIVAMAAQKFDVNRQVAVYSIVVALAMIPSSLVVVLTITMAVGAKTMAKQNVVVRKLDALEALGSVNDICSDKTGTLTQGKMIVKKVWVPSSGYYDIQDADEAFNPTKGEVKFCKMAPADDDEAVFGPLPAEHSFQFTQLMDIASLANIAVVRKDYDDESGEEVWKANGDPTEIAVQVFVHRLDWQRPRWTEGENPVYSHLAEFPFDSSIKRMSTVYQHNETENITVFTKGAAERIIGCCSKWYKNDELVEFTEEDQELVQENVESLTKLGLVCIIIIIISRSDCGGVEKKEKIEIFTNK